MLQFRRQALVAVEAEYPVVRGLLHREVLLLDVAEEFLLVDLIGVFFRDRERAVGAERVDDYDLVGDRQHALQAVLDLVFLVEGNDADADGGHACQGAISRRPF